MPAGDLYQMFDFQDYVAPDPNVIMNAYAYRQVSGDGDASALINAWVDTVLPAVVNIQSVAIGHTSIQVFNLDDFADFADLSLSGESNTGTQTGDCLPRYNAYAFIYHRTTRAVRNGWKRIAGVPESFQVNGVVTNSGALDALEALAVLFGSALTDGDGNVWNPRIYRRALPDHVPPVTRADFAIQAVAYERLTTQNTRKR